MKEPRGVGGWVGGLLGEGGVEHGPFHAAIGLNQRFVCLPAETMAQPEELRFSSSLGIDPISHLIRGGLGGGVLSKREIVKHALAGRPSSQDRPGKHVPLMWLPVWLWTHLPQPPPIPPPQCF